MTLELLRLIAKGILQTFVANPAQYAAAKAKLLALAHAQLDQLAHSQPGLALVLNTPGVRAFLDELISHEIDVLLADLQTQL